MKFLDFIRLICFIMGLVYVFMAANQAGKHNYPEATYELVLGIWLLSDPKRNSINL